MKKFILTVAVLAGLSLPAAAQIRVGDGQLSGSFETNSIYYFKDEKLGDYPEDHFGTNNYIKADYTYGRFSAGIQGEGYFPALKGYDSRYTGFNVMSKYIQWQDDNFNVLVGDIYDQYGSGLIFRSFEDRALGFNNSIEGVSGMYRFGNYVTVKGMYGRPRIYMSHAGSWVRGADLNVSLSDIFKMPLANLSLEGSYVNRYEALDKDENINYQDIMPSPNVNMYSGRLNFDYKGFTARGEYVAKSADLLSNGMEAKKGSAILAELGYNYKRLALLASFRSLDNMNTVLSIYQNGIGNVLNYIPALTRQYTYQLANLNPYQAIADGEIGGQFDAFYSYRSKTARERYWNFHVNFSTYFGKQTSDHNSQLLWRDINFDIERQWSKSLKTTFLFSRQEWNPTKGYSNMIYTSNIFVGDITYKFNKRNSLRVELQYLYSKDYEKDWIAANVEYNMAPRWSFFVGDMYNIGDTKIHYYNVGFSYTKSRTRIQLSYARNREGLVCSGGVCRLTPAFTGINLMLTTSF